MISVSTTKSNSNWLDRLRSSKGFPTGGEPDLDRFLSASTSGSGPTTDTTHSESTQCQAAIRQRVKPGGRRNDEQLLGEVSNVLCELFNMGESSRSFSKKKSSRKQENPRFCGGLGDNENELCSSDDLRREKSENGLASSGDNSLNERRESNGVDYLRFGDVDVEERENVDLKEYSRSEVMVIDTSLPEWKFDGWVFRKNDEWKMKEKKIKSRVFGGKKRKLLVSTLNDDKLDMDETMKKKKKNNHHHHDESLLAASSKGQPQNNNDRKEEPEPFKEATDFRGKFARKRFPCPRPPKKLGKEGSSVILLKSIPLNDSNIATKLRKSSHKKRPKKMKIV